MVRMCHTLYSQIFQPHWHVFYPKSALWFYNSHSRHKYRSEISFCRPVDSSLQIPISTDEILKNRFLMQTQSYHNYKKISPKSHTLKNFFILCSLSSSIVPTSITPPLVHKHYIITTFLNQFWIMGNNKLSSSPFLHTFNCFCNI